MVALILSSHGLYAQEALKSVEMIMGNPVENVGVVSVTPGKDYDTALLEMQTLQENLNTSMGTVILTDIYGGTPANAATYLALTHENVLVISGFNLPVLLELMYQRDQSLETLADSIQATYHSGMTNISEKLKGSDSDGDQMDSY